MVTSERVTRISDWLSGTDGRLVRPNDQRLVVHTRAQRASLVVVPLLHKEHAGFGAGVGFEHVHSGCRLNEILSAKRQDVDLTNKLWHISGQVAKGKRAKVLPLSEAAILVFQSVLSMGDSEYVIVSRTGQRMTTITKTWSRIRNLANLPHYRFHDLRHQFATHLARSGCSTVQIQQLLSHRSPVTTQKYLHLSASDLLSATNSTSAIFEAAMPITQRLAIPMELPLLVDMAVSEPVEMAVAA